MKAGELFKGDVRMPYVTFMANDVRGGNVGMTFDGSVIKVTGVTVANCLSDSRPFIV